MSETISSPEEILQNYVVIRELSKDEEPSHWTRSQLAVDTRTNEKVLISRLDKIKYTAFYNVRAQSEAETDEEKAAVKINAEAKYKEELEQFVEQHKKVVGLSHPNIAKVIDVGIDQGSGEAVVTVEYVDGAPIFDVTNGMSILGMIPIFLSVLEALDYIHDADLLHLNLKSKRILVKAGFPSKAKLTDYGYAINIGNVPERVLGSAKYSAPEVIMGQRDKIGVISDLYSFAVLAYCCMTRVYPFPDREDVSNNYELREMIQKEDEPMKPSARNTFMLRKDCDKFAADKISKLEDVVMTQLKPNPDDRPLRTASEFQKNISGLFQEELEKKKIGDITITKSMSLS